MTEAAARIASLPVGPDRRRSASWWGVICLIATEAALFAYLLFSYFYSDVQLGPSWRPAEPPKLLLALPNTLILLLSSVAVWLGERAIGEGRRGRAVAGLAGGLVLGAAFVAIQLLEWKGRSFGPTSSPYGSLYFTITGFHMAHVVAGLLALALVLAWTLMGQVGPRRTAPVANAAVYWHFVDAVWLLVFTTFYITPRLW